MGQGTRRAGGARRDRQRAPHRDELTLSGSNQVTIDGERPGSPSKSFNIVRAASRILDHLEEWLIATLIAAATLLIFVAVVHRYGTGASIDLAKWLTAHGVPLLPDFFKSIYRWLSARDL
ncbi:MAG: hypothetical protein JO052_13105, partial [Bradyrhizobium sp.]|nr:hypothetical protein [Bradyrhizobium sp.]